MINRHDDNNDSPKQVDGFNTGGFGCGLWVDGCEFYENLFQIVGI
jgi:hypothetical protein